MTARKPRWEAKKNKMVPAAPATPAITASSRARPPHSTKLCTATAATSAATTSPAAAAATGHIPLPEPARSSPMNSSAKNAPATRP